MSIAKFLLIVLLSCKGVYHQSFRHNRLFVLKNRTEVRIGQPKVGEKADFLS